MIRARLGLLAGVAVAASIVAGGCGDDTTSGGTLPPIITTTTSTTLPATTTTTVFYDIQPGDTLDKIAARFGVTRDALIAKNNITDPDHIEVGQRLEIPPQVAATTTSVATSSTA